jgi:hypothetical protein
MSERGRSEVERIYGQIKQGDAHVGMHRMSEKGIEQTRSRDMPDSWQLTDAALWPRSRVAVRPGFMDTLRVNGGIRHCSHRIRHEGEDIIPAKNSIVLEF